MPCHNGSAYAARAISSVLEQTVADVELLFVDDGSTDNSASVAETRDDPRIRVIRSRHLGVSAARNRGIAEAQGALLAFLDVDDTWHPAFLERMISALAQDPGCAIAYCGWQNVGAQGGRAEPYVPPILDGMTRPDELLASCPWPIHAALTRTECVRAAKGFESSLAIGEDFLLWLEIACFHPIVRVPEVLAYYHHHGVGQASRHALRAALQALAAQELFLKRHPSVGNRLGRERVRQLTLGKLLQRGYESYWKGDIDTARGIFRRVIRGGYGRPRDWTYMLPALLPSRLHRQAVGMMRSLRN
jgi:glycosyltransferase involved in cell wall biosynthesis